MREKNITICEAAREDSARKHILVVDDERVGLKLMKTYLEDDYEVSLVNSGEAALEFMQKHKPDLVLLDYMMPTCNGADVLKKMRDNKQTEDIPVFFLTGATDHAAITKCLACKPEGYIVKPIGKTALLDKLKKFFNGK